MAKEKMISIAILGAGNMGTALAQVLALRKHQVRLWDYNPRTVALMERTGKNERFLPGVKLSRRITPEADMGQAVAGAQLIIVACAAPYVRETVRKLGRCLGIAPTPPHLPSGRGGNRSASPPFRGGVRGGVIVAHVAKGVEDKNFLIMHEVVQSELPPSLRRRVVTISGPSIAKEFVAGVPTAVVAASQDTAAARLVQKAFISSAFRVEISRDWKGVGFCGALKNVYAIALGMCDGMQFMTNVGRGRQGPALPMNLKAFIFAAAVREMEQIVPALGGKRETVYGLAGIGDLVVTGLGQGRNRALGERICKEDHCKFVGDKNSGTFEGITAARVFYKLCRRKKARVPIIDMVYKVLYKGADPCKKIERCFKNSKL